MRRFSMFLGVLGVTMVLGVSSAFACGSLVAENGAVRLVRTTTLAAYHDGFEHYVTSFQFQSIKASFGSVIPLPAKPSKVERGGDWTLQRLEREVNPPQLREDALAAAPTKSGVEVIQQAEDRRARRHRVARWWSRGRQMGGGAGLHAQPRRARDVRVLLRAFAVLPRREVRRRRGREAGAARRRRDPDPHHHSDGSPVGSAAHSRYRQAGVGDPQRRRVRAHRLAARLPHRPRAGDDQLRRGVEVTPRRPAQRQGHELGAAEGMAHRVGARRAGRSGELRPRHRWRRRGAGAGGRHRRQPARSVRAHGAPGRSGRRHVVARSGGHRVPRGRARRRDDRRHALEARQA